jgi:hypothetical protein
METKMDALMDKGMDKDKGLVTDVDLFMDMNTDMGLGHGTY